MGKDLEREQINYAKNEVMQYKFLMNIIEGLEIRIDEMIIAINNYKSSPVEFTEGQGNDPYWKNTLRDRMISLEEKKETFEKRLNPIRKFFDSLNDDECTLIKNIYLENKTFAQEAQRLSTTVRSLERYIDRIMLKFDI